VDYFTLQQDIPSNKARDDDDDDLMKSIYMTQYNDDTVILIRVISQKHFNILIKGLS